MNFSVDEMVLIKELGKMCVCRLQLVKSVDLVRKFFGKFVRDVRQFCYPCFVGLIIWKLAVSSFSPLDPHQHSKRIYISYDRSSSSMPSVQSGAQVTIQSELRISWPKLLRA